MRLVGAAWGEGAGRTWVHREPRERTLGDMLRRLQTSLTAGLPRGTPVVSIPAGGAAAEGRACVQVTAVEPMFDRGGGCGVGGSGGGGSGGGDVGDSNGDDDAGVGVGAGAQSAGEGGNVEGGGAVGGGVFPTTSAFIFDVPFVPAGSDRAAGGGGPAAALRTQWRRRTTVTVDGQFPGLRARLEVSREPERTLYPNLRPYTLDLRP